MAKFSHIQAGDTSQTLYVFIPDSSSTTGAGLTGLDHTTGGTWSYCLPRGTRQAITLASLAAPDSAWSSGGFEEVDATNMPGVYRLDIPDASIASGDFTVIHGKGATNAAPVTLELDLGAADTIADQVWDEAIGGHVTAGTTGKAANDILADTSELQGDDVPGLISALNDPTTAEISTKVWQESLPALFTNGQAGGIVGGTGILKADMVRISGDIPAADALESQYDGTGLTGDTYPATQAALGKLAVGSSAVNTTAVSTTVTQGTETLTYTATAALDDSFHQIADTASGLDFYYQFNVTADGVASSCLFDGYLNGVNDTVVVQAYNWGGVSWDQIGSITGIAGSTISENSYQLTTAHTGTGANDGLVRIRFYAAADQNAEIFVDRILVGYAVVRQSVGYSNGAIWIDTNNGSAGTTSYVNGTADNPVDTIADALTLSAALNIYKFEIAPNSTISLAASAANLVFVGSGWNLGLGSQSIAGAQITGASITGESTGSSYNIYDSEIGTATFAAGHFHDTGFSGTFTASEAGTYIFSKCFSEIAGSGAPIFDIGAAVGVSAFNFRSYSGGVDLRNFGATGADTMSLEGQGQLILNANCTGGTASIRGSFSVTDNSATTTLTQDANTNSSLAAANVWEATVTDHTTTGGLLFSDQSVAAAVWDKLLSEHSIEGSAGATLGNLSAANIALAVWQYQADGTCDSANADLGKFNCESGEINVNDKFNGFMVSIIEGTGKGQTRWILDCTAVGDLLDVIPDFKTQPDNTSRYVIHGAAGSPGTIEGTGIASDANGATGGASINT